MIHISDCVLTKNEKFNESADKILWRISGSNPEIRSISFGDSDERDKGIVLLVS